MEEENKAKNNKNKTIMIAVVAIIFIVTVTIGGFVFAGDRQTTTTGTTGKESGEVISDANVQEFDMTAKQWEFTPSTITVKQGDLVKLNITSIDVTHGFAIADFGVNQRLEPDTTVTVEFIADKKGTFSFFCSVQCGAGHSTMNGTLVVE